MVKMLARRGETIYLHFFVAFWGGFHPGEPGSWLDQIAKNCAIKHTPGGEEVSQDLRLNSLGTDQGKGEQDILHKSSC
jgi:hypothetical protein